MATLSSLSAGALTPKDIEKKLGSIIVFTVVDDKDAFYQITTGETDVIPLYLQFSQAQDQLSKLISVKEGLKGKIRFFRLDAFYRQQEILQQRQSELGRRILSRIVSPQLDMKKAAEILEKEGIPSGQIKTGLKVPVFYSDPMLSIEKDGIERKLFFLSYSQMVAAIEKASKGGSDAMPEFKAADLSAVLELILKSEKDIYSFVATEDGVKVLKALGESSSR